MSFVLGDSLGMKPCVIFRVKWLRPAMKGTFGCAAVADRPFWGKSVPPLCSAMSGASCVRSSMRVVEFLVADRSGMAA